MWLSADVGGTKTLVGVFAGGKNRPEPRIVREYATLDFDNLPDLITTFLDETGASGIRAAAFGVAGPVTGLVARMVNVPWVADAEPVGEMLDAPVALLNDLEAMAHAVPYLEPDELATLQEGVEAPNGNAALIAAGTGLGEALLHNIDGRFVPAPSEGGHADFAARTPRELAFVAELSATSGRVDHDRVISGPGLVNLYRFTHGQRPCSVVDDDDDAATLPARISECAIAKSCPECVEALDMFVAAYGAEAGNLALRSMATAGLYVGGGIAPKLLPVIEAGGFMDAFLAKEPLGDLLRLVPVRVILNEAAALLGAAVYAERSIAPRARP
jgi:glucokinase